MKSKYLIQVAKNGFYYVPVVIVKFNRFLEAVLLYVILQSFTKYLRLTLVLCEIADYGKSLISVFQEFFASINKIFIL